MIGEVIRVCWTSLRRDRIAQLLSFVLPVAFFSIFALIFSQQERSATARVPVLVVDENRSDVSARLIAALKADGGLDVRTHTRGDPPTPLTRAAAEQLVRDGKFSVAMILPPKLADAFGAFFGAPATSAVELVVDRADPVAPQMIAGLLQKAAMTAAPDLMIERGLGMFTQYAGELTPAQQAAMNLFLPKLRDQTMHDLTPTTSTATSAPSAGSGMEGLITVRIVDALDTAPRGAPAEATPKKPASPAIALYAAGTAVMFLLFMASGAGGALIEEEENGTIERLLSSRLGMTQLILGKWLFLVTMGVAQVTLMFVWGWLVFGLDLPGHVPGFSVMALTTSAAAAAFGLMLAAACRTRAQLGGVSTLVILVMSAIGGSMFPRFLMSEEMKRIGLFTFNGWALDGFQKVFWYNKPTIELWPQALVITALAGAFLLTARLLARRWETA